MSMFRSTPGPTRINDVRINQSVLGYPWPVVMGRGKIQQSVIWLDGYNPQLISSGGGKGFGGGKDGNQFVYTADVIAGLCSGPILGIGDVWCGQSWLRNSSGEESYTIVAGVEFTPERAAHITADQGVSRSVPYNATVSDLGGSGSSTLSGTHLAPLKRVSYGSGALASGTYAVSPSGAYKFSPADAGTPVQLYYSLALTVVSYQVKALIPSSGQVSVGSSTTGTSSTPFSSDGGVVYYSTSGDESDNGNPVPGYTISGTTPAVYQFQSADIGKEVLITYSLDVTNTIEQGTSKTLAFSIFDGNLLQTPWALLETNFPGAALGYSGIAFAAYSPMDLGYEAQIQENTFEVMTGDAYGGGIGDCNPVQCIGEVLTNAVWGLGAGPVPFPGSVIDLETWGSPFATGTTVPDSTAASWFAANGFFISPVIDKQDTASSLISKWLEAGQCAAFMSEGLLKLVPYGDTSTAGNGAVWVAPNAYAAALDDTCFLTKDGDDPVKISSSPYTDAMNVVQIGWSNRANQYATEITPEWDQAAINRYGSRIEDPQQYDFITSLPAAAFAASLRVKRSVYLRNTYEFALAFRYTYLEPMDVVLITTSSAWANANNQNLNVFNLPVRITKIVDRPDGTLDVTAEDYPFGANHPVLHNKALAAGVEQPNLFALPGDTEAVVFEAPERLTGFAGDQIWIGATGASDVWGGCNILVSMDGDTFVQLGTIALPARLGKLAATLPAGSDPDTVNTVTVQLVDGSRALEAGTTADADQNNTLCYVDGELLSYSACTVVGEDEYAASGYLRRGQLGSVVSSHAAGSLFMRVDGTTFKYTYDPSWYGKTVKLKFQSFNVYGNSAQDISTLTAVPFTVPGLNPGTVDAASGLVFSGHLPPNVATNVGINAALASGYDAASGTSFVTVGGGASWTYQVGSVRTTYPAASITGLSPTLGDVYVIYDTQTRAYLVVPTGNYASILNDFYIVLGTIAVSTATGGGTTGGYGGGDGGITYGCTEAGTHLDTPEGPVDNRILKSRLDAGETVYLSGRFGPERLEAASWITARLYEVKVGGRRAFRCSGTHMLRRGGYYVFARDWGAEATATETRDGYEPADVSRTAYTGDVLRIHLAGPSHEYSVHGVMTHNVKAAPTGPSTE